MARFILQGNAHDGMGKRINEATVTVYLANSTTLATIYAAVSGGSAISGSTVETDEAGHWNCFIDEDDYDSDQRFKAIITKTNFLSATYDYLQVLPHPSFQDPWVNATHPDFGATGDGTTDDTTAVQTAIDYVSTNALGTLYFPPGTYVGNFVIKSNVIIKGAGQGATIFQPKLDDHVFETPVDVSTVRIGFEDCYIDGNATFTSSDGIHLETTTGSTWVSQITIRNVRCDGNGRYGLRAVGTAVAGPYVERLRIFDSRFHENEDAGISLAGTILETGIHSTSIVKNGGSAGTNPNMECDMVGAQGVSTLTMVNCSLNHALALAAANTGTALYIKGGDNVQVYGGVMESADPYVYCVNNATRNIGLHGVLFASNYNATSAIELDDCKIFVCENCTFGTTGTFTYGILSDTAVTRLVGINIKELAEKNWFASGITTAISFVDELTISSGAVGRNKSYHRIDTESNDASDDLDSIFDENGTTAALLKHGEEITIRPINTARTVVVKHGTGNIHTNTGADITLDELYKTFVAKWDDVQGLWLQVGGATV